MRLLSTNASQKPLYAALGLPDTATSEQIHQAFLNISRAHHPDVRGDVDIFARAKHAHDILMDPAKRKIYDETGLDPDSDEKMVQAFGLIRNIVAGILNDGKVDIDIVDRLRRQMENELSAIGTQIRNIEIKIERAEKMSKNINKRWQGSSQIKANLVTMMDGQIQLAKTERIPLDHAMEVVNLALKLIENVRYESEVSDTVIFSNFGQPLQDPKDFNLYNRLRNW